MIRPAPEAPFEPWAEELAEMSKDDLAAAYLETIGYDPFVDDPSISEAEVRETLIEYWEPST